MRQKYRNLTFQAGFPRFSLRSWATRKSKCLALISWGYQNIVQMFRRSYSSFCQKENFLRQKSFQIQYSQKSSLTKLPIGLKVTNHQQRAEVLPGYWHEMMLQTAYLHWKNTSPSFGREDNGKGPKTSPKWNSDDRKNGNFSCSVNWVK